MGLSHTCSMEKLPELLLGYWNPWPHLRQPRFCKPVGSKKKKTLGRIRAWAGMCSYQEKPGVGAQSRPQRLFFCLPGKEIAH